MNNAPKWAETGPKWAAERLRHHLEGLRELQDGVLIQAGHRGAELLQLVRELDFGGLTRRPRLRNLRTSKTLPKEVSRHLPGRSGAGHELRIPGGTSHHLGGLKN